MRRVKGSSLGRVVRNTVASVAALEAWLRGLRCRSVLADVAWISLLGGVVIEVRMEVRMDGDYLGPSQSGGCRMMSGRGKMQLWAAGSQERHILKLLMHPSRAIPKSDMI